VNPGDLPPVILGFTLFVTAGAVLIFRGPLGRAIARRIEGSVEPSPEIENRVRDLEERLAQVEHDKSELVERLDFAERMLSQVRDAPRELPR
jgi:hypothetical protein